MSILERLTGFTPNGEFEDPFDLETTRLAIIRLQEEGWTDDEIVSMLKWLEHVNPLVEEEVALRNMKLVKERVTLRLAAEAK